MPLTIWFMKRLWNIISVTNPIPLLRILSCLNKRKTVRKMLRKHPPKIKKILLKRRSFRMSGMKLLTKIELKLVISIRNSNHLQNFKYMWKKKFLELEAAIVSGRNEQTPPQNNISGNYLTSILVINILKNRISFLESELSKKDTIINYLSNELITSERSKSQDSTNCSRRANIYESITIDNYANDTIKKTRNTNENEVSVKKPRVIIAGDSLGLSKDNRVKINF